MTANENPFENELTGSGGSAPTAMESKTGESLKYSKYTVEQVLQEFQTDGFKGLCNSQDIVYRRSVHGPNEMEVEEEESLFSKFLSSFYGDPLILLLMGSAVISFLMSNIDDAVSITMAITIVVTVGFVQEYRSEKSLEALNKLVPAEAHLTRNGNTETVLAANLVPGDLVDFSVGDRIPADVRIIHASHLTIDESNLTGENLPVSKNAEPVSGDDASIPLNKRSCIGFMGTLVRDGNGRGIVIGTAKNTAFGAVFEMMSSIEKPKTPLQQAMDKLGKDLSAFSFGVIGLICLVGIFQGRPWLEMFQISVSLAVAAIPEGLPIIVTVTLALGVLRMAKQRAIVKRLPSVETLGSVNVICSDKTGTLTQNHMTVNRLWTVDMNDSFLKIEQGESYARYLKPDTLKVLQTGNIVNNAKYSNEKEKYIGNPTDIAIIESLEKFDLQDIRATKERMLEIPFSSSKKYQAVSVHSGDKSKSEIFVKGALNKVLERCTRYYNAEGTAVPLTDESRKRSLQMADTLASSGLRILSFAHDKGSLEENGDGPTEMIFCGLLGMNDPPRPSVGKSILKFMRGGVHIIMITGDSESTAVAVAKQIGMVIDNSKYAVLSGDDIDAMSTEQLAQAISHCSVFARTTPKHKVAIVRALQARGDIVAMTGDGVNDAPALKLADIGIAMGNMGTDVAKEAADMVLTDDDFSTILSAIQEGKGIFYNIQNFLTFQLSTSIAALSLIALSTAFNLPNPLNAMQILWINIIMDGPPAQSLGVEPVDKAVMNKPPRKRNDKILTSKVIQRVLQSSFIIVCGTLYVYMREIKDDVVTARDTTMTFTCFVFFDMFNALTSRHHSKSILEVGWGNTMFNFSVLASILGQLGAIYIPFLQSIFQTEPLSFGDLAYLLLLSSSVWIVDELRKLYVRRRDVSPYNGYSMAV